MDELASTRQGVLDGLAIYTGLRGTERAEALRRTIDSGDQAMVDPHGAVYAVPGAAPPLFLVQFSLCAYCHREKLFPAARNNSPPP
jgi:hypothetical protein